MTFAVAVFSILTITAAWYYRVNANGSDDIGPRPERVAALAVLLETGGEDLHRRVVAAANSDDFVAVLHPRGSRLPAWGEGWLAADDRLTDRYAAGLAGRPIELAWKPLTFLGRSVPRVIAPARTHLAFRIRLRTGDVLAIKTAEPIFINRLGLPPGFGAGMLGTLIALVALIVMHRQTRPLRQLAAAVDTVDFGGDPVALPDARRSAPEIRAVVAAFDRLQSRLSAMLRARLALIGGISHDVRTFAARLRLRVEALPDEMERARAIADIDDMIRLLNDALIASRAGAGELAEEMVEFGEIVAREIEDRRAGGARATLSADQAAGQAVVLGDRLALRRIVANLVDNALKYGHAADAALTLSGDWIEFSVADEGPGIPLNQRSLMLEPFSRLDHSRNRRTGGAGLGLAIARGLVEAHGGRIEIADAPGGGARLGIYLPVFRPG